MIDKRTCDCESIAHSDPVARTPRGNQGHVYGAAFSVSVLCYLETAYGVFRLCQDCASDCHSLTIGDRTPVDPR